MNTSKQAVSLIADICRLKGIRYAVFSPGSRSAPLVIAFSQIAAIECIVIPDERVAGYFALGLAQQTQQPVAVICTSGTAVLNLGPALCEAFYQHIPVLFLTADRPKGAAEKGENQAINQAFLFKELTNASYDIDADITTLAELLALGAQIETAVDETKKGAPGPVHVNVRMSEPLYNFSEDSSPAYLLQSAPVSNALITAGDSVTQLTLQLADSKKKLVVAGMHNYDPVLCHTLELIAQRNDTVVLVETTSNLASVSEAIYNYDACLDLIPHKDITGFIPEVVITLGGPVISKKLRQALKANKPQYHWDVSPYIEHRKHDIFDIPTNQLPITETEAVNCLLKTGKLQSNYASNWHDIHKRVTLFTQEYLNRVAFTDLKVFELLTKSFPQNAHVQYGNSTPVRYSNIFHHPASVNINSNRGASGIDGSVSTAAGAAYATKKLTICIVGDVSFFYDSNALWNNYLSEGLRIIIINNAGGNIFRLLNGPSKVNDFEKFFETRHNLNAKYLAGMYDIPYYFCEHQERLEEILAGFFKPHNGRPAILEIKTDGILSADVYKGYFDYLKNATDKI